MANRGNKEPSGAEVRLEGRVADLERKIAELSEQARTLQARLRDHEARFDERIQKIANLLATTQAGRV